jgi:hypothetical protein
MAYSNCAAVNLRTGAIRQQLPRSIAPDIPWLNKGYQYVDETRIRCDTMKIWTPLWPVCSMGCGRGRH